MTDVGALQIGTIQKHEKHLHTFVKLENGFQKNQ